MEGRMMSIILTPTGKRDGRAGSTKEKKAETKTDAEPEKTEALVAQGSDNAKAENA